MRTLLLAAVIAVPLAARAQSWNQGPPPPHRVTYRNLLALRLNPIGLTDEARITYRYRLYKSESLALRDNFVAVGLAPSASPAFGRIGAVVEVQPLTVLQVSALYEGVRYFGNFRLMQSFPSAEADFSDAAMEANAAAPISASVGPYPVGGSQLTLGANLQLKVGPVAVRNQLKLVRPDYALRDGDTVFYDQIYDVLAPNRGWFIANDADVLYLTDFGLAAGLRWAMTSAFYGPEHRSGAGDARPSAHRVGPIVAYTFHSRDGAGFNTPTALLILNWHVDHRYRVGPLPYLAAGFAFTGDLLPVQ